MIGAIMSRVEKENERNEDILTKLDGTRASTLTWGQWFIEKFSCSDEYESNRLACYIMTIGVIDECRKLGLGTKMLEYTIEMVDKEYANCYAIYLHVIDYNKSAIRFYNKNGFSKLKILRDHYEIQQRLYNAVVFYRPIGAKTPNRETEELQEVSDKDENL